MHVKTQQAWGPSTPTHVHTCTHMHIKQQARGPGGPAHTCTCTHTCIDSCTILWGFALFALHFPQHLQSWFWGLSLWEGRGHSLWVSHRQRSASWALV